MAWKGSIPTGTRSTKEPCRFRSHCPRRSSLWGSPIQRTRHASRRDENRTVQERSIMQPMLISTDELDGILDRDDVVVVDVRSKMAFVASGHISGAVAATWHDFSDPASGIKGLLDTDLGRLEKKLGALGISRERQIIVYSNPF